jgi:hypothetical protein
MAIQPLLIPERVYGQPIPVAPDTNAEVEKINELVAAVNAGLATSNAIVGGDKFVQYLSSSTYGVPAQALTLDRLDASTILPGTEATVINPHPTPTTQQAPSKSYVATIVPAGTDGAFQVPAYSGATDRVLVAWQEVVDNSSFTALTANEVNPGKGAYAGLALRPLLIALVNGIGTGTTTVTTTSPNTAAPKAPTSGVVDDTGDTFSFITNPAYPSFAQYKVNGLPGVTGAVVLDATNSYVSGNRIYINVVGAVPKNGLAVYVAGSGTIPDGAPLTNGDAFTGATVVVTPPTTAALTAALAISVASIMAGSPLTFTVTAGGGTAPYSYAVTATNNATGAVTVLASASSGSFTPQTGGVSYDINATVTDSAGNTKPATTRTVQVTSPQSANQLPVANAGDDLTITAPTSSVALMGTASDPDQGDTLTYLWRPIAGPNTPLGLPATTLNAVVSNLIPGTYQFGFQATDSHGGKSAEDFVVVTVNAAVAQPGASVAPVSSDFGQNVFDQAYSGYTRRSPMSVLIAAVEGTTSLTVKQFGNSIGSNGGTTVYVDGNYAAHFSNAAAGVQDFLLTLPSVAKHVVRMVEGGQSRPGEQGQVEVESSIQLLTPGSGGTVTIVAPTKTPDLAIVVPDSIGNGAGGSETSRTGWVPQLRNLLGFDVIIDGYGFSGYKRFTDPAERQALLDRCVAAWAGRMGQKVLMLDLGTNDYNIGGGYQNAAATAAIAAAVVELFHSYDSTIKIFVKTPITRLDIGPNSTYGQSLATYTSALLALASSHPTTQFVDATTWVTTADISTQDRVHPLDSGHIKIANKWYATLTGTSTPAPSGEPPITGYAPAGLVEQDSQYVAYIGTAPVTGSANIYSGGTAYTFGSGTKIRVTFTGPQLKFGTPTYPGLGSAKITIDGQPAGSFSQGSTGGGSTSAVLYNSPPLADANHVAYFELDPADPGTGVLYFDFALVVASGASSFSEPFGSASWPAYGPATQNTSNGVLAITPAPNVSGITLSGRGTGSTFNMVGHRYIVRIDQLMANNDSCNIAIAIQSDLEYTNGQRHVRIVIQNGKFAFQDANNTIGAVLDYDFGTMRLLSFRETNGMLYAETGTDGSTWAPVSNKPVASITAGGFNINEVHLVVYAGTTGAVASPGTAIFGYAQYVPV